MLKRASPRVDPQTTDAFSNQLPTTALHFATGLYRAHRTLHLLFPAVSLRRFSFFIFARPHPRTSYCAISPRVFLDNAAATAASLPEFENVIHRIENMANGSLYVTLISSFIQPREAHMQLRLSRNMEFAGDLLIDTFNKSVTKSHFGRSPNSAFS